MADPVVRREFFNRSTVTVARELLGMSLCRRMPNGRIRRSRIVETEAYDGFEDRASHAHRGATTRNVVMFGPPGQAYVYLCYGVHWLLNITTRESGYPAAVLIRGIDGAVGPGRLTKALAIDGTQNGRPVSRPNGLWVENPGLRIDPGSIAEGPRVGVDYAGPEWAGMPWRFQLAADEPGPGAGNAD